MIVTMTWMITSVRPRRWRMVVKSYYAVEAAPTMMM
jgi:hypothetical protein